MRYFVTTCSRLFSRAWNHLLVAAICLHLVGVVLGWPWPLYPLLVLSIVLGVKVALEQLYELLKRAHATSCKSCRTRLSCRLALTYQNQKESDECPQH